MANADEGAVGYKENWENVSEAFTKQIGADDIDPAYLRRCNGLSITPIGDVVMQTSTMGICVSRDQGATWSVVADNRIKGRCENGFCVSVAYPYDGRMAFFCYDGAGGMSGGMSLDGARTWNPFLQVYRGVQFADVDWNTLNPQTIFGLTHEPYFTVLSDDGGENWDRLDATETGSGPAQLYCVGVINERTTVRYNPGKDGGIIELSSDSGRTWIKVANYQVQGEHLVHYGQNMYWATSKGVITSTNGRDWTLTGAGAEGAIYGPYFGSSDQEFVVVTTSNFLRTEDGGKTWKPIAKFYVVPDIFHGSQGYCYFGWDARHNILYASGLGAAVYKLQLDATDAAVDVWANVPKTIRLPAIYQVVTKPAHGEISITGQTAIYTPSPGYSGEDAFTWKAEDAKADSPVRKVRLAVEDPAARLPPGDATLDGKVTFADFQVARANYDQGTNWSQGHFSVGGVVDYRDLLILRDALKDLSPAQEAEFTTFLQAHHTPTIENVIGKSRAGQSTTMKIRAADDQQPNAAYSYRITRKPRHGTATVTGDTMTYTAQGDFLGMDDFIYQANNGKSESNQALITIKVIAPITGSSIGVVLDSESPEAELLEELELPTVLCPDVLSALSEGGHSVVVTTATPMTVKTLASHPEVIKAFTAKGGWLMLWGLTPDGLADFSRLVGVEHLLRPFTVEAVGLPAHVDPLLNGIHANSLNMFAGTGLNGIPLRAADAWSYVLDGNDIAPFAKIPPSTYWRPGVVTGPGSDQYPPNLVNGMDDSWQMGFTIPTTKPEYLKWNFSFPRSETVTQFSLTPDTTYNKIQRIRLTFPSSATQPLEFAVQPSITRQDFQVPNILATGVTLEIITKPEGAVAVTGIRNVWIKVRRSDDFNQKVQPLLSIGVLNKYPLERGGILVNEMQLKEDEPFDIHRKQRRILGVLMHNLLDKPQR